MWVQILDARVQFWLTHLVRYLADELIVFVYEFMCVAVDDLFGQESDDIADTMINSQQFAV